MSMPVDRPRLCLLAGPNGAGKTTFARTVLAALTGNELFLNADDVAQAISPGNLERSALTAGRAVLDRRAELLAARASFVVETTLASRTLLRAVKEARTQDYAVSLIYLLISDPDICIQRVAQRVALGGHFIPVETILRRYQTSLRLLPAYLEAVDEADVYLADQAPRPVLRKRAQAIEVFEHELWDDVLSLSRPRR
jgi:predicted ABC-type ATPase